MAARIFQETISLFQSTVATSIGKFDNVIIDRMQALASMVFQELEDGRFLLSNCCREFLKCISNVLCMFVVFTY